MAQRCLYCGTHVSGNRLFCTARHRYKYYHSGDMVLTLKGKWFYMILSGIKGEEYREKKVYWEKRFGNYFGRHYDCSKSPAPVVWNTQKKVILFRNGYGADRPQFRAECTISEGVGKEEWGAEKGVEYYVLKIHRIFGVRNVDVNMVEAWLHELGMTVEAFKEQMVLIGCPGVEKLGTS